VSRWWPERATVWLSPHKGQDLLDVFARELDAQPLRRRSDLTCVLGGPLVRYRVVPWSDALASAHQRQVLAASCFHEAYGEAARGWQVREHGLRHGAAGLGCAIDAAWPQRLADAAQARGLRLASVQPSLMQVHNALRRALPAGLFWFVWEEAEVTTLVLWRDGEPLHLKAVPTAAVPLCTLLDREWFLAAVDAPRCPVYLVRSAGQRDQVAQVVGWQLTELPAQGPVPLEMAA
jgi:hypothetical protein